MECVYCKKWHWNGVKSCTATGAPKDTQHKNVDKPAE
jgi:hypothetical protein